MNQLTLSQISVPMFSQGLGVLRKLIDAAEAYAAEKSIPVENLLEARLRPDMLSFSGQIGYAYFSVLESVSHALNREQPELSYDEKTANELRESITTVQNFLSQIKPEELDAASDAEVPFYFDKNKSLPALDYNLQIGIPNFYFHVTAAYCILRKEGVPLTKEIYLGI